jgi:DNA polymerase-3 subunit alpha
LKLHVSPPDINKSNYYFNVLDDQHVMYGLGAIKGVGHAAIENIVAARNQEGLFKDLFDFCQRIDLRKINRRVLEALIKSGCFDSLGAHRAQLIASLNLALQHAEQMLRNQTYGQHDIFGMANDFSVRYVDVAPWPDDIQLQGEKETLGFYLTGHPLRRYLNELAHFTTHRISELRPAEHKTAKVAGIVTNIRSKQTKRGDRIGIFTLEDGTTQIEVVCFSEAYQKYRAFMVKDKIVIVEGEVSIDDFSENPRIIAREISAIEQARERYVKQLRLHVQGGQQINLSSLKAVLEKYAGGNCAVMVRYCAHPIQADIKLGDRFRTRPNDGLVALLQEQLGIEQVEFVY